MSGSRLVGLLAGLAFIGSVALADEAPRSARLMKDAGNQFLAAKKYSDAIDCYFQALELYPSYPDAHYNLAVAFLRGYKASRLTIHHLDQYLKLSPGAADRQSVETLLAALRERIEPIPETRGQVFGIVAGRLLVSGAEWVTLGDRIEVAKKGENPCASLLASYVYPDCVLTQRILDEATLGQMKPGLVAVNTSDRLLSR